MRQDWKTHLSKVETETTLHAVEWDRIILDEGKQFQRLRDDLADVQAHIIREPTKSFAMSVYDLKASRRWCVTGTPIQNRLSDLFSLLKFLKCSPFDDVGVFRAHISRDGRTLLDSNSIPKLKALVSRLSLRRPKDTVKLPPRRDTTTTLEFTDQELQLYETVRHSAKRRISMAANNKDPSAFLNALHRVNELRLICNHGVRDGAAIESSDFADTTALDWNMEAAQILFDEMENAGIALCSAPQCREDLSSKLSSETDPQKSDEPRLDRLSNLFCSTCSRHLEEGANGFYSVCHHLPRCRSVKPTRAKSPVSSVLDWDCKELPTKIAAVVKDLCEAAPGVKRYHPPGKMCPVLMRLFQCGVLRMDQNL